MAEPQDATKDFNALELSVQAHDAGISSLEAKVTALEKKLNEPKLLAKTLEDAADDSKGLEKLFSKIFCEMMNKDDAVKAALVEKFNALDRDAVMAMLKKFGGLVGFGVWTVFVVLVTAWAEHHFGSGK